MMRALLRWGSAFTILEGHRVSAGNPVIWKPHPSETRPYYIETAGLL
ncbi:MAG: hypothetical protein ACI4LD_10085 [Lentihominibacter sp.]